MSTYDRKARLERIEREFAEYEEKVRQKDKRENGKLWLLFCFGLYCILLGFMLGISL
ncbi:hypothetical protein ABIA54_004497 [Pseudomonas sp. EB276 TE3739]|jgi:hypothetical protein|uniref:hypothetical protein n=1 Tax=Pseudomonas TaxID=286 RepID=UPI0020A18C4A|nr:hypothetical protein [Pseudomonas koreensis]MCP1476657.1 hypothetical protein [Pseudomonas koreensis]